MPYRELVGVGPDGRMVINDVDSNLLAAHELLTASAHGIGGEWFSTHLDRGVTRSGITTGQVSWFADDFTDISRWQQIMGATPAAADTVHLGGNAILPALATEQINYTTGSVAFGNAGLFDGHGQFYMAVRMAFGAPLPADGFAYFGAINAIGGGITMGYFGGIDPLHPLMMITDGAHLPEFAVSTTLISNDYHDYEVWCSGANYYLSVDYETPVELVPVNPGGGMHWPLISALGGAADPTTAVYDKYLCVFPQAA